MRGVTHCTCCCRPAERSTNKQSHSDPNAALRSTIKTIYENVECIVPAQSLTLCSLFIIIIIIFAHMCIVAVMLCIALLLLIIETSNFKGPQNEFIVHVSPPRMCSTHTRIQNKRHTKFKDRTRQSTTVQ